MIKLAVIGPLIQRCSGVPIPKHAVYPTVILCLQVSNPCTMLNACFSRAKQDNAGDGAVLPNKSECAFTGTDNLPHHGHHSLTGHTLS